MSHVQTVSHNHHDWRNREASRESFMRNWTERLEAAQKCVVWLVMQGVAINEVDLRLKSAGAPIVHVAASPLLHILFKDDCASGGRGRPNGSRFTFVPWVARRFECEIHWSEVLQ